MLIIQRRYRPRDSGRASPVSICDVDGMPEPPRPALDDNSQSLEATLEHLRGLEAAAHERGDEDRETRLAQIVETYQVRVDGDQG